MGGSGSVSPPAQEITNDSFRKKKKKERWAERKQKRSERTCGLSCRGDGGGRGGGRGGQTEDGKNNGVRSLGRGSNFRPNEN